MSTTLSPDICVIGAGSGGLSVAAAGAALGVHVVLIEKGEMGGDCLNYGCVPSKALLSAGKTAQSMRKAGEFGIGSGEDPKIDMRGVNAHVKSVIAAIAPNDSEERFTAMGVQVIRETARFSDTKTVEAGDYVIRARRFVVATGSSPFVPPIPGLDDTGYFTNETIFENRRKIPHLIVIGGGPIGMETAQAHRRLGSKVTVVEGLKALGNDDHEASAIVLEELRHEGIKIIEGAQVTEVRKSGKNNVAVHIEMKDGGKEITGTDILVATGRAPNIKELDLGKARIKFDRKGIKVNSRLRTSNRRVYAIGDVAGALQFTHVAGYHAAQVVKSILFLFGGSVNHDVIPWVTFTDPELAQVGMDEEAARKRYGTINVLRWPYHENDRAQAERKTIGMIKIIANRHGVILGTSIVGANAGEMIHLWTLAISKKLTLRDITGYVAPYPTYSEIGRRAAVTYYAPLARKPMVRSIIGFLRKFG
ncbi:MAG: dihydrolipoyl dehydrogenase family protein [Rhizobiaceae bacterium]